MYRHGWKANTLNMKHYIGYCCKAFPGAKTSPLTNWHEVFLNAALQYQRSEEKNGGPGPWIVSALVDVKCTTYWRNNDPSRVKQVFATWYIGPNEPELYTLDVEDIDNKIKGFLGAMKFLQKHFNKYVKWASIDWSDRFPHDFMNTEETGLICALSDCEDDCNDSDNEQTTPRNRGEGGAVSGNNQNDTGRSIAKVREKSQGALNSAARRRNKSLPLQNVTWYDQNAIPDELKMRDGCVIEIIATTEYPDYDTLPMGSRWWISGEPCKGKDKRTPFPEWVWPGMRADVPGESNPNWIPTDNGKWVPANEDEKEFAHELYTVVATRHMDEKAISDATGSKASFQ